MQAEISWWAISISAAPSLEDARQGGELLHDGLCHTGMTGIIRMKTVGIRLVEHLGASIVKREETRKGVEVDDRNRPNIACLLDGLYVFIKEKTTGILVHLVRLDILVARCKVSSMYWCHYYNLLGRIHLLQFRHGDVDTTFQGVLIHGKMAMATLNHFAWLVAGYSHTVESLRVSFADRHTIVIIVGTHKDKDGIEIIAMLFLERICLAGNVVPLSAAYTINVWGDAEPILQESQYFTLEALMFRSVMESPK